MFATYVSQTGQLSIKMRLFAQNFKIKEKQMKKFILPVVAVATLAFTSCGGGSDIENAMKDLQSDLETATDKLKDELKDVETEVETALTKDMFVSEAGKYEVMFPGTPTPTDQTVPSLIGDLPFHMDMYEDANGAVGVSYNDYPAEVIAAGDPKQLLNDALNGATSQMSLDKEDSKVEGEFMGYPSIDYKGYSSTSNYHNVYKLVLKDNRLYQVMMLSDGHYPSETAINNFMGTFKLTGLE